MPPPIPGVPGAAGGRACGPCDLCCKLPSIDWPEFPELHKPADDFCKHCIPSVGCRIHADRPMHCAAFQCLWLMGFGPEELRPDKIGGYFDAVDSGQLLLLTDRAREDPRNVPGVLEFIRSWNSKRRSRLVVYRAGREVREPKDRGGGGPSKSSRPPGQGGRHEAGRPASSD